MFCKWCGMDSKDDKRCEWCGRPFAASGDGQATVDMSTPTKVVSPMPGVSGMHGSTPDATTAMDPIQAQQAAPVPYSPRLTGMKPITVEPVEIAPFEVRMERYLGVMTPLLAAGMALAYYVPSAWIVSLLGLLFASGLLLGSFRVIGYYDDEFFDVAVLLAVIMLVGPVYATGLYVLYCLVRQDWNLSLLGLMISHLVIRLAVGSMAHGFMDTILHMAAFYIAVGVIMWALVLLPSCMLMGGWMMASFTRPLNE